MKWQKAPEELKTILDLAMEGVECEKRLMFGYPAYFINRNLFIGLYQDQLFMRLSAPAVESLERKTGSPVKNLEPMPGRPMKAYFVIPRRLYMEHAELRKLMASALEHTSSMKPKKTGAASAGKSSKAAPKAAAKRPPARRRSSTTQE